MNPEGIEYTIVLSFVFRTHLFDVYKGGTGWGKYTKRYDKGDRSDLGVTSILMKPDGTRIASYAPGTFMTLTLGQILELAGTSLDHPSGDRNAVDKQEKTVRWTGALVVLTFTFTNYGIEGMETDLFGNHGDLPFYDRLL